MPEIRPTTPKTLPQVVLLLDKMRLNAMAVTQATMVLVVVTWEPKPMAAQVEMTMAAKVVIWEIKVEMTTAAKVVIWETKVEMTMAAKVVIWEIKVEMTMAAKAIWEAKAVKAATNTTRNIMVKTTSMTPKAVIWEAKVEMIMAAKVVIWAAKVEMTMAAKVVIWEAKVEMTMAAKAIWEAKAVKAATNTTRNIMVKRTPMTPKVEMTMAVKAVKKVLMVVRNHARKAKVDITENKVTTIAEVDNTEIKAMAESKVTPTANIKGKYRLRCAYVWRNKRL